jgi:low affinity Fe/Cu permease
MASPLESTGRLIERVSLVATDWSGRSGTIIIACTVVMAWGLVGPFVRFSDTWQLVTR